MNFFKSFLASLLAFFVSFVILFFFSLLIFAGLIASAGSSSKQKVAIPSGSVLHMKLSQNIIENAEPDPFGIDFNELLPFPGTVSENMGLYQITKYLEKASDDERIEGIYLNLGAGVATSWASLNTIREALLGFKESGKFIYAYSEYFGENTYYLASVADSVFIPPSGIFEFNGLASSPYYVKGTFDKLDIKPEIFRVGTYKSATEMYERENMSEANREQTKALLDDIWTQFSEDVAKSRELSVDQIDQISEELVLGYGKDALEAGLVDETLFETEVKERIKTKLGLDSKRALRLTSFNKYLQTSLPASSGTDKVAVIFADGAIQGGKSAQDIIGSNTIVKALQDARKNDNIKAIVLRVNSPGGSALASDIIAEEINRTKEVKPVIASMGDYAASGGYYIAAPCDKIFAQKTTITGSIGIFLIWMNTQGMFNNKLGVTFDEVETHKFANFLNPNFPVGTAERKILQDFVDQGYYSFLDVVKEGRNYDSREQVDSIAQGRVWTGKKAKELGLVDEWGNLEDAIAEAASQAGLGDDYGIRRMPKLKTPIEELINSMSAAYVESQLEMHPMKEEIKLLQQVKKSIPGNGTYTLLPYTLEIK